MNFLMGTCNLFGDPKANYTFIQVIGTARLIVRVMQIAIPILLILMGTIDLGKAVAAQKEDDMKKAQRNFINRLLIGAVVFLVFAIIELVVNLISPDNSDNVMNCVECFLSDYNVCQTASN